MEEAEGSKVQGWDAGRQSRGSGGKRKAIGRRGRGGMEVS